MLTINTQKKIQYRKAHTLNEKEKHCFSNKYDCVVATTTTNCCLKVDKEGLMDLWNLSLPSYSSWGRVGCIQMCPIAFSRSRKPEIVRFKGGKSCSFRFTLLFLFPSLLISFLIYIFFNLVPPLSSIFSFPLKKKCISFNFILLSFYFCPLLFVPLPFRKTKGGNRKKRENVKVLDKRLLSDEKFIFCFNAIRFLSILFM